MQGLFEQIQETVDFVRRRCQTVPRVGLVLGTGLGGLAREIQADAVFPYAELPHFPRSTVVSHAGQLILGRLQNVPVLAMEGRCHFYEGYTMQQVTFPVRLLRALGGEILLMTNAAGGMNPLHSLGDIVILDDHINLFPDNPLRGVNDDRLGPRFPDMSQPYDRRLIEISLRSARELQIPCWKGVFAGVPGPNLETRAEYRMLRNLGADLVGMSTVPEAIVAAHAGLRTLALSVVTDLCLPDALEPVAIERILEVAANGGELLSRLIPRVLASL